MFVTCRPLQHSLMFVRKVRVYPSGPPFKCSPRENTPVLTQKRMKRVKRPARVKHSSLSQAFVNYVRKKFCNIAPRLIRSIKPELTLHPFTHGFIILAPGLGAINYHWIVVRSFVAAPFTQCFLVSFTSV